VVSAVSLIDFPEDYLSLLEAQTSEQRAEDGFVLGVCIFIELPIDDPVPSSSVLELLSFGLVCGEGSVGKILNYGFSPSRG